MTLDSPVTPIHLLMVRNTVIGRGVGDEETFDQLLKSSPL